MKVVKPQWIQLDGGAPIFSVDIDAGCERIATGGQGDGCGLVVLWHLEPALDPSSRRPRQLCRLTSHASCVNAVRFAPITTNSSNNKRWLASGAVDGPDSEAASNPLFGGGLEHWRCAATLRGHDGDVLDLQWSPLGDKLASASVDNTVTVWQAWPAGQHKRGDDGSLCVWRTDTWRPRRRESRRHSKARRSQHAVPAALVVTGRQPSFWPPMRELRLPPTAPLIHRDKWASDMDLVGHIKGCHLLLSQSLPAKLSGPGAGLENGGSDLNAEKEEERRTRSVVHLADFNAPFPCSPCTTCSLAASANLAWSSGRFVSGCGFRRHRGRASLSGPDETGQWRQRRDLARIHGSDSSSSWPKRLHLHAQQQQQPRRAVASGQRGRQRKLESRGKDGKRRITPIVSRPPVTKPQLSLSTPPPSASPSKQEQQKAISAEARPSSARLVVDVSSSRMPRQPGLQRAEPGTITETMHNCCKKKQQKTVAGRSRFKEENFGRRNSSNRNRQRRSRISSFIASSESASFQPRAMPATRRCEFQTTRSRSWTLASWREQAAYSSVPCKLSFHTSAASRFGCFCYRRYCCRDAPLANGLRLARIERRPSSGPYVYWLSWCLGETALWTLPTPPAAGRPDSQRRRPTWRRVTAASGRLCRLAAAWPRARRRPAASTRHAEFGPTTGRNARHALPRALANRLIPKTQGFHLDSGPTPAPLHSGGGKRQWRSSPDSAIGSFIKQQPSPAPELTPERLRASLCGGLPRTSECCCPRASRSPAEASGTGWGRHPWLLSAWKDPPGGLCARTILMGMAAPCCLRPVRFDPSAASAKMCWGSASEPPVRPQILLPSR
uniref:Protein HIRA n=1 Tax=Macrostomum lignano TaxID=282301 RepID=A0A1I8FSS7_9PLAT